jgi:hypothetical protein
MTTTSALPLAPDEYDRQYMNRLIKQLELALRNLSSVRPLTVGSDLSTQVSAYPISGLTIVNVPTSSTGLPSGSVWSDGGVLKIVS